MTSEQQYVRPEWVCGRYSQAGDVAICYNLLEGMSFLFEDASASVFGAILRIPRNGSFELNWLSRETDISEECLAPFMEELLGYGLLTRDVPTKEFIAAYRANLIEFRKKQVADSVQQMQEATLIGEADAEKEYMARTPGIFSVMFELTYRCSEMCLHCYNPGATRNNSEKNLRGQRQELNLSDYRRIIDELAEQGLVKVCLSGGDPFSKDIVWDIMDYLYERGIAFDVFTNGISALGQAERLANYYPRTIGISLYSDVAEVHDQITRIKGSHDKTIEFIAQCSALALPMTLKCCIMRPNVKSYSTVKEVAQRYGALPQFDLNITDSVEGDHCASQNLRLRHEELEIVLRDPELAYYIGEGEIKPPKLDPNGQMCNAGINTLCITPEGNVQPCCAFPMKLGNVREQSISLLLESSKPRSWWMQQTLKDCAECYQHPYCILCQMCAGNNYIANGNPLLPSENNCFLAKERYQLFLRMQRGDDPLKGKSVEESLQQLPDYVPLNLQRMPSANYRDKG